MVTLVNQTHVDILDLPKTLNIVTHLSGKIKLELLHLTWCLLFYTFNKTCTLGPEGTTRIFIVILSYPLLAIN